MAMAKGYPGDYQVTTPSPTSWYDGAIARHRGGLIGRQTIHGAPEQYLAAGV
jgi:hypothetical protein